MPPAAATRGAVLAGRAYAKGKELCSFPFRISHLTTKQRRHSERAIRVKNPYDESKPRPPPAFNLISHACHPERGERICFSSTKHKPGQKPVTPTSPEKKPSSPNVKSKRPLD